jgi:hypothetical protein
MHLEFKARLIAVASRVCSPDRGGDSNPRLWSATRFLDPLRHGSVSHPRPKTTRIAASIVSPVRAFGLT